jgi:hypothetical protein
MWSQLLELQALESSRVQRRLKVLLVAVWYVGCLHKRARIDEARTTKPFIIHLSLYVGTTDCGCTINY